MATLLYEGLSKLTSLRYVAVAVLEDSEEIKIISSCKIKSEDVRGKLKEHISRLNTPTETLSYTELVKVMPAAGEELPEYYLRFEISEADNYGVFYSSLSPKRL